MIRQQSLRRQQQQEILSMEARSQNKLEELANEYRKKAMAKYKGRKNMSKAKIS
jgi:hypothetical protein